MWQLFLELSEFNGNFVRKLKYGLFGAGEVGLIWEITRLSLLLPKITSISKGDSISFNNSADITKRRDYQL